MEGLGVVNAAGKVVEVDAGEGVNFAGVATDAVGGTLVRYLEDLGDKDKPSQLRVLQDPVGEV